jgi:hypothetical protein
VRTEKIGQLSKTGEQLQPTTTAICIYGLGSNLLLVMVGIFYQSWLSLCISHGWLLVFFRNHSMSRLRCSGVASAYGWVTILLYCLWLNKHIHYFLTKKSCVALSTAEVEYVAICAVNREAMWLRKLLSRLFGLGLEVTYIWCDKVVEDKV